MSNIITGVSNADKTLGFLEQLYATLKKVGEQSVALEVLATLYYQELGTDIVDAYDTTTKKQPFITAAGHIARKGDMVRFTSGNSDKTDYVISSVTTNEILFGEAIPGSLAPVAADTFKILRPTKPLVDASGNLNITAVEQDVVDTIVNLYASTPVTTGAWVELLAVTSANIKQVDIFDSSGEGLEIGVGALGFEARKFLVFPGGNDDILGVSIPAGSRISIRALDINATVGKLIINLMG